MRATKIAFSTVLLLLLALAGAVAYVPVYLEGHKDVLETGASRALGRPVRIAGSVSLSWSLLPSIQLEDVRIENQGWARGPALVRAQRVDLQLDLAALLNRHVRFTRLVLSGAEVHLETGPGGERNWTLPADRQGSFSLGIDSLQALDSSLDYQPAEGPAQHLEITRLELTGLGVANLGLDVEGGYQGVPVAVSASTRQEGTAGSPVWPFKVEGRIAGTSVEANGSVAEPLGRALIEAEVALKGETLEWRQRLAPQVPFPAGPANIRFKLDWDDAGLRLSKIAGSLDAATPLGRFEASDGSVTLAGGSARDLSLEGRWRQMPARLNLRLAGIEKGRPDAPRHLDLAVKLGGSELTGNLQLALTGTRPSVTGDLRLTTLDLRNLGAPGGPASDQTRSAVARSETWLREPLPIGPLRTFDADLELRIDRVAARRLTINGLKARTSVSDGLVRLEGLSAGLPGLTLSGRVSLDGRPRTPTLDLALDAGRVELPQALSFLLSPPELAGGLKSVSLRAKSKGDTPESLLGALSGELAAGELRLKPTGAVKGAGTEIRLTKPRLSAAPGAPSRLSAGLVRGEQTFDIQLTGGPLKDLWSKDRPWPTIAVAASGQLGRDKVEIRGTLGPLGALLAGRDLQVDLSAEQRGVKGSIKGRLARLDGLQGSRLDVKASGGDLARLGDLLDVQLPGHQPFLISAGLEGGGDGLELHDLKATSGASDIAGTIKVQPGTKPRVNATLDSRFLDLTPYLGGPTAGGRSGSALDAEQLELLHTLDGTLRLSSGHVRLGDFGLSETALDATLDSGHLHFLLNAGAERINADVGLRPERTQWRLDLKHKGNLDLAWLMEPKEAKALSRLPAALDLRLNGVGTSLETMLGTANGHAELVLGAGRLTNKAAALPFGNILLTLLDALSPLNRQAPLDRIQCAVLQFDVADGIATSTRGLAVQTDAINAIGGGAINLRTQEIELHFKTAQRKGIGISLLGIADKFIYVRGTLTQPRAAVDPAGLLIHGGAAWATGGLSLLIDQLANRLTASGSPCDAVLRKADR